MARRSCPAQGLNHIGPLLERSSATDAQSSATSAAHHCGHGDLGTGLFRAGRGLRPCQPCDPRNSGGRSFRGARAKIWTTWAHHSDWMFALVRTDPQAQPRQAGISFLLLDLRNPGIRVRPIKTIAGDEEFVEVFFDDSDRAGPKPGRKSCMTAGASPSALLGHERLATSNPQFALMALERIKTMARARDHGGPGVSGSAQRQPASTSRRCRRCSVMRWSSAIRAKPGAGSLDDQDFRIRAAAGAQRPVDRDGRRPRRPTSRSRPISARWMSPLPSSSRGV